MNKHSLFATIFFIACSTYPAYGCCPFDLWDNDTQGNNTQKVPDDNKPDDNNKKNNITKELANNQAHHDTSIKKVTDPKEKPSMAKEFMRNPNSVDNFHESMETETTETPEEKQINSVNTKDYTENKSLWQRITKKVTATSLAVILYGGDSSAAAQDDKLNETEADWFL